MGPVSATPQANSNLAALGAVGANGPYSVTNKNSGNGPQLPMPNSRNPQPGEPNSGARHSKLRNGSNPVGPSSAQNGLQQLNVASTKGAKKSSSSRDNNNTLPAATGNSADHH